MAFIPSKVIEIETLEVMFARMANNTPKWDLAGDLLWGYFFLCPDLDKLEHARDLLLQKGYRFVRINLFEADTPSEPDIYGLHVEKVEHHNPQSLDMRNNELYLMAHEMGINYDGMDVGPVEAQEEGTLL